MASAINIKGTLNNVTEKPLRTASFSLPNFFSRLEKDVLEITEFTYFDDRHLAVNVQRNTTEYVNEINKLMNSLCCYVFTNKQKAERVTEFLLKVTLVKSLTKKRTAVNWANTIDITITTDNGVYTVVSPGDVASTLFITGSTFFESSVRIRSENDAMSPVLATAFNETEISVEKAVKVVPPSPTAMNFVVSYVHPITGPGTVIIPLELLGLENYATIGTPHVTRIKNVLDRIMINNSTLACITITSIKQDHSEYKTCSQIEEEASTTEENAVEQAE